MKKPLLYVFTLIVSLVAELSVVAADAPQPYTIHPVYVGRTGVTIAAPENNRDLRALLAAALGGEDRIDRKTYYLVHRIVFNTLTGASTNGGWYIYYEPWHKLNGVTGFLARLDDPLISGNFKRTRLYGAAQIQLVPLVIWPAVNFSKQNDDIRLNLGTQAADALARDNGLVAALKNGKAADLKNFSNETKKALADDTPTAINQIRMNLETSHVATPPQDSPAFSIAAISIAKDAQRLQQWAAPNTLSAVGADFVRSYAAWLVRETIVAYVMGPSATGQLASTTRTQMKLASGKGKQTTLTTGTFRIEDPNESDGFRNDTRYVPEKFPEEQERSAFLPDYKVTVAAREAQPASDLKGLISVLGGAQGGGVIVLGIDATNKVFFPLFDTASVGDEPVQIAVLPADVTIDALLTAADGAAGPQKGGAAAGAGGRGGGPQPVAPAKAAPGRAPAPVAAAGSAVAQDVAKMDTSANVLASIKLINEKKYPYDIGAGVPLTSLDAIDYDSTNGVITSKQVEKQNVYGFLLLHPYPTDISSGRLRLLPGLVAGLPLAGKPLNQQIYGASIGLWKVEPFIGLRVTRTLVPVSSQPVTTPSPAATASSLHPDWGARMTFGIVIPVSSIKSIIAPKSSGGGGSSTTSANAAGTPGPAAKKK